MTGTYVNQKEALQHAVTLHNQLLEDAKPKVQSKSWSMVTIMQPWPKLFTEQSLKRGENVLGLERFDENLFRKLHSPPFLISLAKADFRGAFRLFVGQQG